MAKQILLLNGPNLNLLGERKPEIYGKDTLADIEKRLSEKAKTEGFFIRSAQSNSEGELIDEVQKARKDCAAMIINPGAYSHTSIALRDAVETFSGPIIEVHLSNIYKREAFRHHSYISPLATGVICGLGPQGYDLALDALAKLLK